MEEIPFLEANTQLVNYFPTFTRRFITVFTRACHVSLFRAR